MGEPLRACPNPDCVAPGGPMAWYTGLFHGWCVHCGCGMRGPGAESESRAVAAWNALPRSDWRPAADPPQLPPGSAGVYVWAERKDGTRHPWWYTGAGDLLWPDVSRWHAMPGAGRQDAAEGPQRPV